LIIAHKYLHKEKI